MNLHVSCRLVATRVEFAFSIDAALASTRAYLERSAREMAAKVPGSAAAAGPQEGDMPLEVQLQVLAAWHTWLLGALRHFKVGWPHLRVHDLLMPVDSAQLVLGDPVQLLLIMARLHAGAVAG